MVIPPFSIGNIHQGLIFENLNHRKLGGFETKFEIKNVPSAKGAMIVIRAVNIVNRMKVMPVRRIFNIVGMVGMIMLMLSLASPAAMAGSHLWRFSEFYSSPDRSIQFIEMQEIGGSQGEVGISNHWFQTGSYNADHTDVLGTNLPFGTANKKFLVGTVSYAALPGVPAPDYIVPDGILEPDGDTVAWWFYQVITIPPATMPSDGVLSITVVDPGIPTYSVGVNSPTNFAGDTGTVSLGPPPAAPITSTVGVISLVLVSALMASIMMRRRNT